MALAQTLLLILSSAGYISFIHLYNCCRLTVSPFLYIAFVVVFLYCFAVLGYLPLGAMLCLLLGIAAGAWVLWRYRTTLASGLRDTQAWHFLYFTPFLVFFFAIPEDFLFTEWDEFSFWASSIKLIHQTDALWITDSAIGFKHYPPGQQLFQYYITYFTGWSEGRVLYAQIAFMLSALLAVAGTFMRRAGALELAVFWTSCVILYLLRFDFAHILVDQLLAVCFAASLAITWNAKSTLRSALTVSMVVALLMLIKQVGLILGLVTISIYWISLYFDKPADGSGCDSKQASKAYAMKLALATLPLATQFLINHSWQSYVASIGALTNLTIPSFGEFYAPDMLERTRATSAAFLNRIQEGKFIVPVVGFLIFSGHAFWLHGKSARRKAGLSLAVLFLSMAGYTAFLFISYLVFFSEYEGVRLASFSRYSKTYFLAWALVLFALTFSFLQKRNVAVQRRTAIALTIVFMAVAPKQFYADIRSVTVDQNLLETRKKVEQLASTVKHSIKPGERVYFVSQNSSGYENLVFRYAMMPHQTSQRCWSLGKPYGPNDVWTCDGPLNEQTEGYSYLAIYHADDQFWKYASGPVTFSGTDSQTGVFRIVTQGNQADRAK